MKLDKEEGIVIVILLATFELLTMIGNLATLTPIIGTWVILPLFGMMWAVYFLFMFVTSVAKDYVQEVKKK